MDLIYSAQLIVSKEHLDKNEHVNNVQYVQWVEQIAAAHWEELKSDTDYANDYWVLVEHHIQYHKEVREGEILTIKTYPLPPIGVKQPRKVAFYCNDKLVVTSSTQWILMDAITRKLKRIDVNWLNKLIQKRKQS